MKLGLRWPLVLLVVSIITSLSTASYGAQFSLVVQDSTLNPLPSRVLVRPADGQCVVPKGSTTFVNGPDTWFVTNSPVTLDVPEGPTEVRVERGLEYVRVRQKVDVPAKGLTHKITLRRWTNLRKQGYLCGENHIHIENLTDLGRMLAAEGMDFGSTLQWWDGPRINIPNGPAIRELGWDNAKVPTSVYDAELEQSWGAAYIINIPNKLDWVSDGTRPNLTYLKQARQMDLPHQTIKPSDHQSHHRPLISYNGGWDRECLLDALLGYVDTIGICNNQFHTNRFQPRPQYSNLLDVPGFPIYPGTPEGMLQLNTNTYYRLLNCGLKLATGAGTAAGVKQSPPGWNRAYVECKPKSSYKDFCSAWAAGRNFVTNGPVIFLSIGTKKPGDSIDLAASGGILRCSVKVETEPKIVLCNVEIIVNGELAATIKLDSANKASGEAEIPVKEGSWIAARCTARDTLLNDDELKAYAVTEGLPQLPSNLRFAHTSPIYVSVGGKGAAVEKSIKESLLALDFFEAFAHKTAGEDEIEPLIEEIAKARKRLSAKSE